MNVSVCLSVSFACFFRNNLSKIGHFCERALLNYCKTEELYLTIICIAVQLPENKAFKKGKI